MLLYVCLRMVSFRVKVLVTYVFLSNGIFRYRRERGVGMGGGGGRGGTCLGFGGLCS